MHGFQKFIFDGDILVFVKTNMFVCIAKTVNVLIDKKLAEIKCTKPPLLSMLNIL